MLDRLAEMPAVTVVSAATCLPLSEQGCFSGPLYIERRPLPAGTPPLQTRVSAVADHYFDAMGTRVLAGRAIDRSDLDRNEAVAVVNQALANMALPQQDPIGQRVRLGNPAATANPTWLTIVGVVANTSSRALAEPNPVPMMYVPMLAVRVTTISPPLGAMSYVVRTDGAPQALAEPVRRSIMGFDANLAIAQVRTLADLVDRASAQMAFTMVLLALAAGVALLLGIVGVYGVMSYIVSQRTGEIGVRLALGARPGGVVAMIVRQGGTVALAGTIIGLAIALTESRLIASLLYGVNPRDPAVYGATGVTLFAIALMACWLPARRAAVLNPLDALRTD
jgi:putative ABC transport system permease protein